MAYAFFKEISYTINYDADRNTSEFAKCEGAFHMALYNASRSNRIAVFEKCLFEGIEVCADAHAEFYNCKFENCIFIDGDSYGFGSFWFGRGTRLTGCEIQVPPRYFHGELLGEGNTLNIVDEEFFTPKNMMTDARFSDEFFDPKKQWIWQTHAGGTYILSPELELLRPLRTPKGEYIWHKVEDDAHVLSLQVYVKAMSTLITNKRIKHA